jgi:hypothetical protein
METGVSAEAARLGMENSPPDGGASLSAMSGLSTVKPKALRALADPGEAFVGALQPFTLRPRRAGVCESV